MAQSRDQALHHPTDMAWGAVRFSAKSTCDADVREYVSTGFETAQDFLSLIDGALRKKLDQ